MGNRAVFRDRDGFIIRDIDYCCRVEDCDLLLHVPEAIRTLNQHNFRVIVVTNQSGIKQDYFREEMLLQIHQFMIYELARHGALIDGIYYCPHQPHDKCECRRPKPGLLLKAANDFEIDLSRPFMVGGKSGDIKNQEKRLTEIQF